MIISTPTPPHPHFLTTAPKSPSNAPWVPPNTLPPNFLSSSSFSIEMRISAELEKVSPARILSTTQGKIKKKLFNNRRHPVLTSSGPKRSQPQIGIPTNFSTA